MLAFSFLYLFVFVCVRARLLFLGGWLCLSIGGAAFAGQRGGRGHAVDACRCPALRKIERALGAAAESGPRGLGVLPGAWWEVRWGSLSNDTLVSHVFEGVSYFTWRLEDHNICSC